LQALAIRRRPFWPGRRKNINGKRRAARPRGPPWARGRLASMGAKLRAKEKAPKDGWSGSRGFLTWAWCPGRGMRRGVLCQEFDRDRGAAWLRAEGQGKTCDAYSRPHRCSEIGCAQGLRRWAVSTRGGARQRCPLGPRPASGRRGVGLLTRRGQFKRGPWEMGPLGLAVFWGRGRLRETGLAGALPGKRCINLPKCGG